MIGERVEVGSENKKEESDRTVRIHAFGIVMARVEFPVYYRESNFFREEEIVGVKNYGERIIFISRLACLD